MFPPKSVFLGSAPSVIQTVTLAGGPTPVSRRILELWRGQQGEDSSLQVAISAGDTTVYADRNVLMGWCAAILLLP